MREIIGEADNAQKALNELDKAEIELAKKSDDELAQMDKSLGRGTPQPNSNESVTQQSLNKAEIKPKNSAETKLLNEIDPSSLNDEQKAVFEVLTGQKDKIILQGKNLNDLYILERGTRQGGARKIITKHGGVEKTGGLSNDEILDMMKVVRDGELDENSFTQHKDFIRYAYDLKDENGLNLRLVVNEYNDGKKVFDFYSNRNFTDYDGQSWQKNENIQMPKKSLLEQARENTERLRAEQEAEQIAQKEAELARLKEMQAKNAEILAQKEAAANKAINEAQSLEIGTPIKAQKISDTKIIINDNTAPFKAEFIIAKKDDIKPNFERTGTQGRSERQDKVIESIQSDFKPHLIFEQMGGFEGLPIVLKDGQVIAGNHRAQAIKGLTGENLARYKQAAKEKFGVDLKDDEVIVRLVKDGDEKELINLAFMSNVGRESNLGEKALANLAKYESNMQNLPNHINADSVFELESQVAKALDTQGNGLNVFDTNLALLSKIAKNSSNTDILESLNTLKNLSQDEKEKVLRMFVSNAGEFHNLAKDTQLKSLNLNDYLADALIIAAKNVDEKTRKANFQSLFSDIQTMLASAKEMLKIDPFLFENFKSKALGYALARFARLENPAGKLFDFLKASKGEMENLYTGGLFDTNKAISDIDIYDFLKHAINSGDDLMDNGVNLKHAITSKLDDLRKVENALIDSGDIQFAKSKAKPKTIKFIDNFTQNSALFKTLDNEKQQAILKIKEIEAEKMPDNLMNLGDFENLQVHFSGKADEAQRQKYAPLFDITTQKPDIKLKTSKDGQERTEYIKAFQHKESKDMFYIAITQENDKIKITGIPTTQISKVVNDIIKSEKVLKAGNFETISNPAELNKVSTLNDIIPKIANKFNKDEIWAKNLYEWHKDSSPLTKNNDGTPKVFYHGSKDNGTDFEVFALKQGNDTRTPSAFFSSDENTAKSYIRGTAPDEQKTFKVFLNVKNPLIIDFEGRAYVDKQEIVDKIFKGEQWFDLAIDKALKAGDYDGIIFKNVKDNRYGAGNIIADTIAVFNPNQIKSIDNTGKFDNTNDNILFALGKAKPQGREAKETSINSLFADDELQMQATKPAKELNLSDEKDFNELGEFFKLNSKDKEFNEIYDKAAATAQRLGVKVRFDESAGRSHFVLNDNTITIAAANKELFQAQDLLHELIHATTRKALKDFSQSPEQAAKIYTKRQIEAINEINSLYLKSKGIAKRQGKDAYALQNVDEFVAELSSSEFRAFLKAQDIFERFIKALIRFFTGDSERLAKNVNSYKALKESYYKILDDYEPQVAPKSENQLEFEKAQKQIGELKARKNEILKELKTQDLNEAQRAQKTAQLENTKIEIENAYRQEKLKTQIGTDNLTADIIKQTQTSKERIIIDELDKESAEKLGFENSDFVARSIDAQEIEHTLNRHGINSERAKNGEKPITYYDIAEYPQVTKTADEHLFGVTESGKPARVSFKQINGYYVVVEEVHNGQGELAFKSMYFSGGKYENGETYKKMIEINKNANSKNPLYLPRTRLGGSEIQAGEKIIPNSKGQSQVKDKKEIIAKKIDIVDKFDEKQYTLWNSELHRELTELQDKINKSDGKNLGIMGGDLKDKDVMSFFISMRYDVFAKLSQVAKLPYESCEKIKKLIKKGKKIDFNDRNLSVAINKFENPLLFIQAHINTRLPQPYKDNLYKELEKILKKVESKSQENIQEFKRALKGVDELNSLDLSYAPKQNNDEIQITLPKEKQTRFTMRQNAYKSLKEVEKTPLTNANDGRVVYLNKTGRQESLSDYAINESAKNGFDETQHLATAQHLPELFENAKFKETTKDLKNNDKNVKIHRYTANFLLDNEPAQAQITLKETIAGQHSGNKIYTLKLESVSRLSPAEPQNPREALSAINDPKSSGFGEPSTKSSEIVSKIQEKFKFDEKKAKDLFEWHKDSSPLTKNDDGTPKVFYHGSPNEFEVFDIEKTRGELGHYFTDDKSYAEQYMRDNGKIYAVFLKSKNIISLFDPKAAQKYKKFIFGDDLPELEKILKEKYKSLKASEYDLDNYKSAFYDLMRERNDKNVLRVPSIIGERLKTAGVDGVVSYKGAIVVFDSNQIKSIDNTGSWTDSAGKITKEKPSDESARHSYFNAQSPNILHSNEIWGGGLAGGTLNGLETDENGNIIGFNPAKFVAGFIAGAAGTKAVKSQFAKKYATITSEKIKKSVQNALENLVRTNEKVLLQNPQGFIKELDKKGIAELLNSKGNIKMSVGDGKAFKADEVALNLPQNVSKMERKRLELFSNFIKNSLDNANFEKSFNFGKVSDENAQRLKMITNFKG